MFGATPVWFTIGAASGLAAIVSYVFQFVKPLLEAIPLFKPGSASYNADAHDQTLRALVFLLNLGGVVALAAIAGAFDLHQALQYAMLAGAQTLGGHLLYAASTTGKVDAPVFGNSSSASADVSSAPASVAVPTDPAASAAASA